MALGFIGYFDLLGFSQKIMSGENFLEQYEKYLDLLEGILKPRKIDYLSFSDSVILSSPNNDITSFIQMCESLAEIQYELLMELNATVCGAISYGVFNREVRAGNGMITGRPLLEAIEFEKKQNWIGIMVCPSVIGKFFELVDSSTSHIISDEDEVHFINRMKHVSLLQYHLLYFNNNEPYEALVVVPRSKYSLVFSDLLKDIREYKKKLNALRLAAPDSHSQNKYSKMDNFLHEISQNYGYIVFKNKDLLSVKIRENKS